MNRLPQPPPDRPSRIRPLVPPAPRGAAGGWLCAALLLGVALLSGAALLLSALPRTAPAQQEAAGQEAARQEAARQAAPPGTAASVSGSATEKYAGTYRIEDWQKLESRALHHFFYLHPDGHFLLAGEWPGNERSRFGGAWSVTGDRLYLNGQGEVATNQGAWRAEFSRTYRIRLDGAQLVLAPEPAKNRYGLMGWPNAFRFYRRRPAPNLPGVALPADAAGMAQYIAKFLTAQQRLPKQ